MRIPTLVMGLLGLALASSTARADIFQFHGHATGGLAFFDHVDHTAAGDVETFVVVSANGTNVAVSGFVATPTSWQFFYGDELYTAGSTLTARINGLSQDVIGGRVDAGGYQDLPTLPVTVDLTLAGTGRTVLQDNVYRDFGSGVTIEFSHWAMRTAAVSGSLTVGNAHIDLVNDLQLAALISDSEGELEVPR